MGTWRSNNGFHSIFEVGSEEFLYEIVHESWCLRGAFADVWISGQEIEEDEGGRDVVLWEGGVVEDRLIARLVFDEGIDVLGGDLGDDVVLG